MNRELVVLILIQWTKYIYMDYKARVYNLLEHGYVGLIDIHIIVHNINDFQ